MIDIIVIGVGGSSKVICDIIEQDSSINVIGFLDDDKNLHGTDFRDKPIIGSIDHLDTFDRKIKVIVGIGANKDVFVRKSVYEKIQRMNFSAHTIISEDSVISETVKIGNGCIIMPGVIVNSNVTLGDNVFLNTGVIVEHDCSIGDLSFLATGCVLSGNVKINSNTFVGSNSTVIGNIIIGSGSTIGAGSVVVRNISDNVLTYGNPSHKNIKEL